MAAQRVIDRLIRQWRILEALQARRRGLTSAQLESTLGVSRATLYRDLKILVESPLPVVRRTINGETRYSLDPGAWPKLPPTPRAVLALAVARELLRPLEGTSLVAEIDKYLRAAGASSTPGVGVAAAGAASRPGAVAAIERAIEERRRCRLRYRSANEVNARWRTIEPVGMRLHDEALYVAAWDVERGAWRVLKASRIEDVEALGEPAASHPPYDPGDVFAHSAGVWSAPPVDVEIIVDAEKARFVDEYPLVDGQRVQPLADGSARVSARVAGIVEAVVWVLGWGSHAEAVAPVELRAAVAREVAGASARYAHDPSHPS